MNKSSYVIPLILVIVLVGCNLPGAVGQDTQSPDAAFTQAAQTVAAELTRVALLASPIPSATNTPIPCNLAVFVDDVTVPDFTQMAPNQAFPKTWRIRNAGTCSWNSSYLLIFDHGDGMGVTSGYTQQLTSGVVNPGQTLDITVNLTAPAATGTYTGHWRMRDPGGVVFGITPAGGTFIVKIVVVASHTVTLNPLPGESGAVRSNGTVTATTGAGESTTYPGTVAECFLSYDITGIPANATITEVKFDFTAYTILGNPFGSLGVLNAYATDYGLTLEAGDYVAGFPSGNIADWGSATALNNIEASPELKTILQSKVGFGRLQLRLQFPGPNGDAITDNVIFTNPSLIVKYTTP